MSETTEVPAAEWTPSPFAEWAADQLAQIRQAEVIGNIHPMAPSRAILEAAQ